MVKHFGVAAQAWRASFRDKVSALLGEELETSVHFLSHIRNSNFVAGKRGN
jgi:hypothetical protein